MTTTPPASSVAAARGAGSAPALSAQAAQRQQRLLALCLRWRLEAIARGAPAFEKDFARSLGLSPVQWSQHKAGKPLGAQLARRIERACALSPGALDAPPAPPGADPLQPLVPPPVQAAAPLGSAALQLLAGEAARSALLQALGPGAALAMPQVGYSTPAGFPSPAADFETQRVDLVEHLGLNQPSTFIARVRGLSMVGKGIDDGDLLVINRLLEPRHGQTVVALVDNELTCKTLYRRGGRVKLQAANPDFPDIVLQEGQTLTIWGVVTSVIKRMAL